MDSKLPEIKTWKNSPSDKFRLIIVLMVVTAVFIPSLNYYFLPEWDDSYYLDVRYLEMSLSNIRHWLTALTVRLYTPVASLSLMLDYNLFGGGASTGYRLHNLLLHCGSVLLLFGIMRQLRISSAIAAGIALLWAIHPQRIPSVVWISERKDVLAVFFALASMYTYIRACKKQRFSIVSPLFLLLSLGAKPAAMGLPVIMLIYTLWRQRKAGWREISLLLPSFLTVILYYCWFSHLQDTPPPTIRLWVLIHNVMWYLYSGFIPFQLNPLYPMVSPLSAAHLPLICGFILLFGVFCAAFLTLARLALKTRILLLISCALCWGVLFAPTSGLISIGAIDYADRYNYLPSIATWIMLALLIAWRRQTKWDKDGKSRKIALSALFFISGCYWYLSWSYMPVWTNCETLFLRAVQEQYPNPRAIDGLGTVAIHRNKPQLLELASEKYLALVAAGDKLPFYPYIIHHEPWLHSGLFLGAYAQFIRGETKEAFPMFLKLEKLAKSGELKFYLNNDYAATFWGALADCYMQAGRPEEAVSCLKSQLYVLKPDSFRALLNQGLTAFILKDFAAAEKYWKAASVLKPQNQKLIHNLGILEKMRNQKKTQP